MWSQSSVSSVGLVMSSVGSTKFWLSESMTLYGELLSSKWSETCVPCKQLLFLLDFICSVASVDSSVFSACAFSFADFVGVEWSKALLMSLELFCSIFTDEVFDSPDFLWSVDRLLSSWPLCVDLSSKRLESSSLSPDLEVAVGAVYWEIFFANYPSFSS